MASRRADPASLLSVKATIDIDDALYRRLKVEAARRGRTVRDLVADGVRRVLDTPEVDRPEPPGGAPPPWFGALRAHADNAGGAHGLADIRRSIAAGRRARP